MAEPELVDPLSWQEARLRLRQTLEEYLKEEPCTPVLSTGLGVSAEKRSLLSTWIYYDLDLYAGSLLLSVALFIVSCISWLDRENVINDTVLNAAASASVYRTQFAASVLLLTGAALSLWMLRSRHKLWRNDSENAKRRIIRTFLRKIYRSNLAAGKADKSLRPIELDKMNLHGTSLTDNYVSVFQPRTLLLRFVTDILWAFVRCSACLSHVRLEWQNYGIMESRPKSIARAWRLDRFADWRYCSGKL
jgi:uncharacterized membrane protein